MREQQRKNKGRPSNKKGNSKQGFIPASKSKPTQRAPFKPEAKFGKSPRKSDETPKHSPSYEKSPKQQPEDSCMIVGRRAVMEAFDTDVVIEKICVKTGETEGSLKVIMAKAQERGIFVQQVPRQKLDELSEGCVHQGVVAICAAHEYAEIPDILEAAAKKGEKPFILILDGITDPHNFGAIIRSADASGVHGIIIGKRRSVGLTPIVSKTSAGAASHVPVARVSNIANAINDLKKAGLFIASADAIGQSMYSAPIDGSIAIVIGSEGNGVSRLVKEKCDFAVKIPMYGAISSLNASVAAGILMYEVVRRRQSNGADYGKEL